MKNPLPQNPHRRVQTDNSRCPATPPDSRSIYAWLREDLSSDNPTVRRVAARATVSTAQGALQGVVNAYPEQADLLELAGALADLHALMLEGEL